MEARRMLQARMHYARAVSEQYQLMAELVLLRSRRFRGAGSGHDDST
jgi:hypothetical protein